MMRSTREARERMRRVQEESLELERADLERRRRELGNAWLRAALDLHAAESEEGHSYYTDRLGIGGAR